MGIAERASGRFDSLADQVEKYFEAQLITLGLSKEQIEDQDLEELEESLQVINDAIEHPESFGVLRLKMTAEAGAVVTSSSSEAHFEIGILPILLKRRRFIQSRIKIAREERKVENLQEEMESAPDKNRAVLEEQLKQAQEEIHRLKEQESEDEKREEELKAAQELDIKILREKRQTLLSLLERESVATILGSVLLAIITIAMLAAMFLDVQPLEIVSNAFLVLLGYFFGQTITRLLPPEEA